MNTAAKGRRVEAKAEALLEALGYSVGMSSRASKGVFDVVATHPTHTRYVQVKANKWPGSVETESIQEAAKRMPPNTSAEVWRWRDRAKHPDVRVYQPGTGVLLWG